MENHFFSSSSSFPPTHIVEAVGERETVNNSRPWYPRDPVSERTMIPVRHGFGLGVVQTNREAWVCRYCLKWFRNGHALGGHLKAHKKEREVVKLRQKRESLSFPANDNLFRQLVARRGVLSNDNHHLGSGSGGGGNNSSVHPALMLGVPDATMSVVTRATPYQPFRGSTGFTSPSSFQGLSCVPFKFGGGGSSSSSRSTYLFNGVFTQGLTRMKTAMLPPLTPNRFRTEKTLPTNNRSSNDVDLELTLGSSSRRTYPFNGVFLTQGLTKMKTAMSPPPSLKRFRSEKTLPSNNCSSHDVDLDLTLGPSKSIGGGSNNNNNSNVNSSFNGEDTRGTTNLTRVVRPRVSRFHYAAGNPLDSITGNKPAYRNTNLYHEFFSLQEKGSGSGSTQSESLISKGKDKVVVPEDDMLALQENGSGSGSTQSESLISKGKDKAMVPEDDMLALQENGSGSGSTQSESLISKGKDKAMVPEDDMFALQENGSGSGSTQSESLISKRKDKAMVPEDDMFALQENGSGSGSTQSESLISKGKDKVMVPEDDLFALKENGSGSGSTQPQSLVSKGKDKVIVPEDDLASLQENGSGSSQPESLVSKGKDKVMVPEDDGNKGLGTIRWLKKRSRS